LVGRERHYRSIIRRRFDGYKVAVGLMEPERIYYKNGSIRYERWRVNNELHRLDGQASIWYYINGSIMSERWYVNGKLHRLDGPSDIQYNENGLISRERWLVNGEWHRLDGPAYILYNNDGSIMSEQWWVNDINIVIIPWLEENNIIAPFSEADQMAIKLRWG
jgi:antitoxin component YwqK of YwqJK toxin-antitoxin module